MNNQNWIAPGADRRISQLRYLNKDQLPKGYYFGNPRHGALRGVMPTGFKLQKESNNGPLAFERFTFKDIKSSRYLLDIINTEQAEELFKSENDEFVTTLNVSRAIHIVKPNSYNKCITFRVVRIIEGDE